MNDTTKALLAIGLGTAGAYAFMQWRRAKAAAAAGGSGGSVCGQLGQVNPIAGLACAMGGVVIDMIPEANPDTENVRLNGPIVERRAVVVSPEFWASGQGHVAVGGKTFGVLRGREIPRHKNGCVPIFGTSDKCATGTVGYARSGLAFSGQPLSGAYLNASGGPVFEGDPLTQRANGANFPLACSGQEKWWIAGYPKCCPAGWSPVRRHNDDGTWSVECQAFNLVLPVAIGAVLTPVSASGTKPDQRTQGGSVVTVSDSPRNKPVLPSREAQQQAAIAAVRNRRP